MNTIPLPVFVYPYRMQDRKLDVVYPLIPYGANEEARQRMNRLMRRQTQTLIREQGYPDNPQTESTGSYEIKTNERNVLSLSLLNYAYSGGAHGLTLQKSLTFDTETGRRYELSELFRPDSRYAEKLGALIEAQIKERDLPLIAEFPGIKPDQDYYIADKALVIYYQIYEMTPYAYQFPYFPISVYELQDILVEDGPLGRMIY